MGVQSASPQSRIAALAGEVETRVRQVLARVPDPEIPVLSVIDLGVVRAVELDADGTVRVGVAPTYSGCPATAVIKRDIIRALQAAGFDAAAFDVLSPPWTSDWISAEGHRKLREYGIAPPTHDRDPACPRCGSRATRRLSEFGSTPCKALYRCASCLEPFERFKCH
jgi:ring-1,2-phenylacetyl-CoA epoxidase subunit PaaD